MSTGDRVAALTVVLGLYVFPASPIFQVGWPESLALLLMVIAFVLLGQRRYGWVLPVAVGLALTRRIVLALAIVIALHWVTR